MWYHRQLSSHHPWSYESRIFHAEAERIIQQAVQLFVETRQEWLKTNPHAVVPLCLGACGPYGAYLADGSEYRGHYDVSDET